MSSSAPQAQPAMPGTMTLMARVKACLFGAVAAVALAPLLFAVAISLTPATERGFWHGASDVVFAVPAIWLFAAVVAVPTGVVFGPALLALAERLPLNPRLSALVLGAILGLVAINVLPVLFGDTGPVFHLQLSGFGAATGAIGAWVSALSLPRTSVRGRVRNAG